MPSSIWVFSKIFCCTWTVGCQKFVQYICMLCPGRFILDESVELLGEFFSWQFLTIFWLKIKKLKQFFKIYHEVSKFCIFFNHTCTIYLSFDTHGPILKYHVWPLFLSKLISLQKVTSAWGHAHSLRQLKWKIWNFCKKLEW